MSLTGKVGFDAKPGWDETIAVHREQLRLYLDYLIECKCSKDILSTTEAEAKEHPVPDRFKLRLITRILVKQVIRHMRECPKTTEDRQLRFDESLSGRPVDPPGLQRLVYFLRDVLEYSRRDVSLLIGITDAHSDHLLSRVRQRIDLEDGPSTLAIETPVGIYFRWIFRRRSFSLRVPD